MRKVALLLVIPIIAVILSSCTFVTTRVKDSYIQKEYIDKVKVPEKYKVGTKEIKFYVDKVVDSRKTKHIARKGWYGIPIGAPIKMDNTTKTLRITVKKALLKTGWGVTDTKENADYLVDLDLKKLEYELGLLLNHDESKALVCVYRNDNGDKKALVLKKVVKNRKLARFEIDFTGRFRGAVGHHVIMLYKSLLEFFSSPEFVNAIKEDYYNTHSVKQERAE